MTNEKMEQRLASAVEKTAPNDVNGVLSRCDERKGTVIPMTTKKTTKKRWTTLAAACLSWPLLPEGLLKNANPLWNWAVSSRPLVGGLQIFGFNLIFACVLVGANLFARGPQGGPMIPCGYSCLLLLFLLYGLMVGTWSFQMGGEAPPFAARLLRMLHISEASGMVEMSAFCCIASGTADISFVQTLGGRTTVGRLRDIRLSRQDGLVLALGFLLLFAAAMIEAASILRLT